MHKLFLLMILFTTTAISTTVVAQQYIYNYNIPVFEHGRALKFPLAGGLNNPQFSNIDINQDGKQDIFIFDRAGGKVLVLINDGAVGDINYFYWQQYEQRFPQMQDWAILVDYNCDGFEDIITGYDTGIRTFLATEDADGINFIEDVEKLKFTEAGFFFDLPVGTIDIPGFADINMDGDIDVLTFYIVGGVVDYYENRQIENGLPCGTWALEHVNSCWGNFYESGITKAVDLDTECKGITGATTDGLHAGSTFMIFDEDADNDMDIVLGDLAFGNLNKLTNGGDNTFAHITEQDTAFPAYDNPYEEPIFPAAFLVDVNNDGHKDMLVSPNNVNQAENFKNVSYYKNTSADDTYVFDYQNDSLFVSDMIDVGDGSYPTYFDYNYDGLLDLIIGNYGYLESGDYAGKVALYENIGTNINPQFSLITRDLAGISAFDFNGLITTFGDLDGDGDEDLLLGEEDGFVHFFKNIGPPEGPASFILFGPNYQGIDPGQNSAPQLIDITNDGLLDLLIGEKNGNINYYHNTGTAAAPIFTLENEFWGNVDVRTLGALTGHAVPFLYKNTTGQFTLYVGCEGGTIYNYSPTADFSGAFTKNTSTFNNIDEGNYSSINIADINSDNLPDIVTGNQRGGITIYRDEAATAINNSIKTDDVIAYPNPTADKLIVLTKNNTNIYGYAVYSIEGSLKYSTTCTAATQQIISMQDFTDGIYIVQMLDKNNNVIATIKCCKM